MRFKIEPILGDASFRTFYRVKSNKNSKILIYAKKDKYKNLIAYSATNNFLRSNKILAPKVYSYNHHKSMMIIEDFGDLSFGKLLLKRKNKFIIYKRLVDLLLKIQKIKPKFKIKSVIKTPHLINKYSNKYLHEESDLFFDWYLTTFLKKKEVSKIKKRMREVLNKLYKTLYFSNSCFVHRDYHVQNLMKVGGKIGVIDSQDALIGNPAYDLVSLIDDVRIKTSLEIKKKIFNYYLKKNTKIRKINSQKFINDFNILSVQRSLKIIGIFTRLYVRDKKIKYLRMIPYTWKLLEMRMRSKIFTELRKIIDKHISKKIRKKIIFK